MITLSALHIYPIKSCGGISLPQAAVGEFGLNLDRSWMLVDGDGRFLSQREHGRMATISTALEHDTPALLTVRAPGMADLHLPTRIEQGAPRLPVTIWDDVVDALDCSDSAHRWFSDYLQADVRLVRFDPQSRRVCSQRWTGDLTATTQFSDGFPILVVGEASLQDLNLRLQKKGTPALPMDRFRPNLVLSGLEAYEEDYLDTLSFGPVGREVVLKLVKPCARCPVPGIDQQTGLRDADWPDEPLDTMAAYRANERVGGGLTFGQNAIVVQGWDNLLAVGQDVVGELAF
ncbi:MULTISPECIES: MOSC N-terminal beta barrel domain-containing protein [unclassified Herbaspirillum]|uniref:MOSC domain-containing protein n=1 Tax=unclassified Herbaspirillum TaxID=2624150 RepID=UPI000E2E9C69|nr:MULTISPECIES: MOSC N-terminal beta barrel domain-containing protein [unclassified Herbaspirillum]RFB73306.1 MOSC domain-containing protein [Herbaspirillum sp. 3R-3a1]TFI10888.1 MOSC domain-containing protein [Herbaspirillum sp. 3R11]TFI16796.1 MOSC domain-containing protein [Herbaspirillum sp. 3R-11]TFI26078.1 MOSC domain-containing protein [Herbaspirillum sp. 3C11]